MKEKQIMVMLKRPGCEPELEPLFENTLEAFQAAVGGYIETCTLTEDLVIICNEEGKLYDSLPYNVTICGEDFVGTILAVGVKGDEFASIPARHIPLVRRILRGDRPCE